MEASPQGYLLLWLIRSYLELDMYASLVIQSTDTLDAGKRELLKYHTILEVRTVLIDHTSGRLMIYF